MTDVIDEANELAQRLLNEAIAKHKASERPPLPVKGVCYFCDAVLDDMTGRFCGPECRDDWQAAQEAARRNGRPV